MYIYIYMYVCIHTYIYTYIMHNASTQSRKVNQTLHPLACILSLFERAQEVTLLLQASMLHACTCKDKRNKEADKQGNKWKEKHAKDKLEKMPNGGEQTCAAYEKANKNVIKHKGVSQEDKCRFGLSVHISIGLEYGRHIDSCMNIQATVQRCKGVKKAKQVAQSKQGKHNNIAQNKERFKSSTPTPQRCISQVVTSI